MKYDMCDDNTIIKVSHIDNNAINILSNYLKDIIKPNTLIVCIGTDKCIGDCLGPLVGTLLLKNNYPYEVIGTLENPAHAVNLNKVIDTINSEYSDFDIIAIDACLSSNEYIGSIQLKKGPIHPGKGVGKNLPRIGNISIIGIVDTYESSDIFSIKGIRLNLIMKMAEVISSAIISATL